MAEIHVQTKKQHAGSAWIWILIALIIAAVIVYFVVTGNNNNTNNNTISPNNTTSCIELPQQVSGSAFLASAA